MANNKDFKVKNGLVAGGTIESTTGGIKFPDGTTQTTAVTASGEVNDLTSVVTWANVPDANITQSSVTQHEGALSITESQITDLGSYITASSTDTLTNKSGNISQWTNDSGYLTSFTETNDLSAAVVWANVPDANITQSSVTQHQAALSITESQITDLGSYITASSIDTLTNKSGNISQWTNDSGYLTSYTETNDLSTAVTWANVPDANITQSSVTQHQAALSITESQISDLGTYAPIASPALTGTPTAPTAAASTNTTQIATTAYVQGELSSVSVAFDDLTGKTGGSGTYATTGYFTAGLNSGGVSLTHNDGGGNASVTFNHRSQTPEQTGNAGRIRVNTDSTTGGMMEFQVGSGLTSGVAFGLTTYFKVEENLLTSNAAFNMPDTKVLQFGTGADWKWQFDSTDAYMTLDAGTWRWRDGAASNALRIQWTPSAGLEFQDGHQLQLGTSNDLRMYHSSNINYFDLVNGDLKIRDVSGTATDRFVFTQDGKLGIGSGSADSTLSIAGSVGEQVYNLTGTDIDPDNGTIQYKTLTGNTTFTESLTTGQYVTLMIDDGTGFTITWPTIYWPGGLAPTLATTGYNVIQLWKVGTDLYGSYVSA